MNHTPPQLFPAQPIDPAPRFCNPCGLRLRIDEIDSCALCLLNKVRKDFEGKREVLIYEVNFKKAHSKSKIILKDDFFL